MVQRRVVDTKPLETFQSVRQHGAAAMLTGDARKIVTIKEHKQISSGFYIHGHINSSPPGENGYHFSEDIFKCII